MIKLGKLTDYGVVLMVHMASSSKSEPQSQFTSADLSGDLGLSRETVAKCLKLLAKNGLLQSQRGAQGGYALARSPSQLTVADVVVALEGPIRITDCIDGHDGSCGIEGNCPVRGGWDKINTAIAKALTTVTIADMATSASNSALAPNQFNKEESLIPA